jgi:hypothetical protein
MVFLAVPVILSSFSPVHGQQEDLTPEINRIRKELVSVQNERERVREEKEKDAEDFEEYRKRIRETMRSIRHETDSIELETIDYKENRDSLAALINSVENRAKQYEMLQDGLRTNLISAASRVMTFAETLPPQAAEKHISALKLLANELKAKDVDNIEAVTRLLQVINDMHDLTGNIQIAQGTSPVPEIRGTAYRFRLGAIFEAVVNAKGTTAAVWTGYGENGNAQWRMISDPAIAGEILKAVNVREGKALPELVRLPLQDVPVEGEQDAPVAEGEQ